MIHDLQLPVCPPLGPVEDDGQPTEIPREWNGDPLTLLPDPYVLNAKEAELATRYRNNDISGGYLRSQIAAFRAPQPLEYHERRREALAEVQRQLRETPFVLPPLFVTVFGDDAINNRLRHNTIWLNLAPLVFTPSSIGDCKAVQFTSEGQGCFYFSLLLCKDGDHCVLYHEDEAIVPYPPPPKLSPRLPSIAFSQCCSSFDSWLAHYFVDCREHDIHYTKMLEQYPGL
jgi:hypothetical protein